MLGFIPFSLSLVVCVCVFFLCIFVGEEVEKMENDQREYEKYPDSVGIIWNTAYLSIWYESSRLQEYITWCIFRKNGFINI